MSYSLGSAVERSHRIDAEEFWGRRTFTTFDEAVVGLGHWEHEYNHRRYSMALGGETPRERLTTKLAAGPSAAAA